jgi:hypothetical protein
MQPYNPDSFHRRRLRGFSVEVSAIRKVSLAFDEP